MRMLNQNDDGTFVNMLGQEETHHIKNQHLPGPMFHFGVQTSQERILCSLLSFLKINGAR
jgi:hypothetical protein